MDNSPATARLQAVSPGVLWFSRIMGWLCWLGIAWTIVFVALQMFGVLPRAPANSDGLIGYASVSFGVHDPAAPRPPIPQELLNDPLYIASGLVAPALMIWALISARTVFASIGRGRFFGRPTSLGLRNLSLAVLLNMILAPIANLAATLAFAFRMKDAGMHGEVYFDAGPSSTALLVLIFAGTVAIISSVMARAAKVAEENEQFV
ncbi:MAG TPA: hypothetical protein VGO52_07090 [Hyphomonadaceae bacterium]|jgi:hypothetical protein|nr:hypothetical protein [Hyphomonadaceae bacterium]